MAPARRQPLHLTSPGPLVFLSLLPATERGTGLRYYGWRIVVLAAISLGMTAPGQTAGVSVFIDPMMDGLSLSRTEVSTAYLVGTLAGAVVTTGLIGTGLAFHQIAEPGGDTSQ